MDVRAVSAGLSLGADVRTPRDLDDLMDGVAGSLPAYSRWLTERLRQFRVTGDLRDISLSIRHDPVAQINAVRTETARAGRLTLQGPGVGGDATAAAVLGDLVAAARGRTRIERGMPCVT